MPWYEAALRWYAALFVATWAWAPAVAMLCSRLPDRGTSLVRPLAILATVYPVWLGASLGLLPYSTPFLVGVVGLAAVVGWGIAWRRRALGAAWLRSMLLWEVVSAATFAAAVWLRGFTPAIVGTEKPMEIAFLSASARATSMPPADPWFVGEPINYYYMGYVLFGSVGKVSNLTSPVAFNFIIPTIVSLSLVVAAGVAFNATRGAFGRRGAGACGAVAAFGVVIAGNAYSATRLIASPQTTIAAWWWDQQVGVGWRSSRIVCDGSRLANECARTAETINEFPFFSFLLGDVHPHVMALPFALVVVGLAVAVWLRRPEPGGAPVAWWRIGVVGWAAGALYALNAWDYPTFLVVALLTAWSSFRTSVGQRVAVTVFLVACSVIAWAPFVLAYDPPVAVGTVSRSDVPSLPLVDRLAATIGVWTDERTSVAEYLTVFGIFYLVALVFLVRLGVANGRNGRPPGWSLVALATLAMVAVVLSAPIVVVSGLPFVLCVVVLSSRPPASPAWFAAGLLAIAFALSVIVELFYLRDVFENRMNTLFKIYYQCWLLMAIAAPIAGAWLWSTARGRLPKAALVALLVVGLGTGAAYPVVATYQWTRDADGWQGLDGIAYLSGEAPDELAGIRWLQANARPDDVVLEAAGCSYQPNGRMPTSRASAYTGVPTIIGWGNHEVQWRGGQPERLGEIDVRERDVAAMFADPSGPVADRYGVSLIYVGRFERGTADVNCGVAGPYPNVSTEGFPGDGWQRLFAQGEVAIYGRDDRPPAT